MSELSDDPFISKLRRLQSGDTDAFDDFVKEYEPYIRRSLRFRIKNARLMAIADSADVCQSVFGGFLLNLSAGEYQLNSEEDMRRLLLGIAKKKFAMLQRREAAAKRSRSATVSLNEFGDVATEKSETASADVELAELLERAHKLFTAEEADLLQRRKAGQPWEQIQNDLGIDAVLLRKRLSRALRRVADELGLEF